MRWMTTARGGNHAIRDTLVRDRSAPVKWVQRSERRTTGIDGQCRERHGLFRCGAFGAARMPPIDPIYSGVETFRPLFGSARAAVFC
jgi:hypothetical protein